MMKFSSALTTPLAVVLVFFCATFAQAKTQTDTANARATTHYPVHKKATKTLVVAKKSSKKATKSKGKQSIVNSSANSSAQLAKKLSAKSRHVALLPEKLSVGELEGLQGTHDPLDLNSNAAFVIDQESSQVLFQKNAGISLPIASITKLMTSLVVLEAGQNMDELLEVTSDDIDTEKGSHSRLRVGAKLSRSDMLHIALMSSENRAASSLGRHYPGGLQACVAAMNAKAKILGMSGTRYVDSTGLSSQNRASAQDLAKMVTAAYDQPLIRQYSTDTKYAVSPGGGIVEYSSSNRLTFSPDWQIVLQKTGYISEAGRCLVMLAMIEGHAVVMVFLDSKGKYSRFADAGRIRKWIEKVKPIMAKTNF